MKYIQVYDHQWLRVARKEREMCCDCQLVHDVYYRRNAKGQLVSKAVRNERATAAARRGKK